MTTVQYKSALASADAGGIVVVSEFLTGEFTGGATVLDMGGYCCLGVIADVESNLDWSTQIPLKSDSSSYWPEELVTWGVLPFLGSYIVVTSEGPENDQVKYFYWHAYPGWSGIYRLWRVIA